MGDLNGASFPDGKFTISCWVNTSDTTQAMTILSKRNLTGPFEYSLDNHFEHNAFKLDNWIPNGGHTVYGIDPLNAAAKIRLGEWNHIAYVADGNLLKVYVNGELSNATDQKQGGYDFSNTDASFVIGNGGGYGANNYFEGLIDDVKLYNRALNRESILDLARR